MENLMLSKALEYAERGWWVFPCRERPGVYMKDGQQRQSKEKQPYTPEGLNNASINPDIIRSWWTKYPTAAIGINCGKSGLFVIDVDVKNVDGIASFKKLGIDDKPALHSLTPSGGVHIIYSGIGKSSANGATGIDTRGEGGYIIAPPSKIFEALPGGHIGEYKQLDDWSRVPPPVTEEIFDKLAGKKVEQPISSKPVSGERKQLHRDSLNFVVNGVEEGSRNKRLFDTLADFAGCGYTKEECRTTVLPTALRIGLPEWEFEQVLEHAFSKDRSPSIPDSIQRKMKEGGKNLAAMITADEQPFVEEALISSMLQNNDGISQIFDTLLPEDFLTKNARGIYRSMLRLFNKGIVCDKVTVISDIEKTSDLDMDAIDVIIKSYPVEDIKHLLSYAIIIKEKSALRKVERLMVSGVELSQSGKSFVEVLDTVEKKLTDIAVVAGVHSTSVLNGEQATRLVMERTQSIIRGEIKILPTGFIDYDNQVKGFFPSELIMIAGKPGHGKSALALSLAKNVAIDRLRTNSNIPTAFFTLEMSIHETVARLISQMTGMAWKDVFSGDLSEIEWVKYKTAVENINLGKLYFDDSPSLTIPELRAKMRKLVNDGVELFIIDQLEQLVGYTDKPLHIQLALLAWDLKRLAKEFDKPIVIVHQLKVRDKKEGNTRVSVDLEPELGDLNQAGEKPVNQVWAIVHKYDLNKKIIASKIKVLKNRNGPKADFPIAFIENRILFTNAARAGESQKFVKDTKDDDIELDDIPGFMQGDS